MPESERPRLFGRLVRDETANRDRVHHLLEVHLEMSELDQEGYVVLATLDREHLGVLVRAFDRAVESRCLASMREDLHVLSAFDRDTELRCILDWPPLLDLMVRALSTNIHVYHSHLDLHHPRPATGESRWHRDGGVQGREMRQLPAQQPRLSLKAAVFLTDVSHPDDGALELVPRSHHDVRLENPSVRPRDSVPLLVPAGTVVVFDSRLWHQRRDNTRTHVRKALCLAYTFRWIASRDRCRFSDRDWKCLPPIHRQLLGDSSPDPFYPRPEALAIEQPMGQKLSNEQPRAAPSLPIGFPFGV